MEIFDNILETVGRTPVVRLNRLAPEGIDLFVKLESFNPMGSVKDRAALSMIEDAERRGLLRPGQTVIEATSGNTGIALAMVCAQKGYRLVIVMAENFSVERRRLMRFLGAKVILTPAAEKGTGMVRKAQELATHHGWFLCNQFENQANARVHRETTAVEILQAFRDRPLDYIVLGAGTGGSLNGIARAIREHRPRTRIVVAEPANSPLIRRFAEDADPAISPGMTNPAFRPHPIQGVSPDFVPALAADAVRRGTIDEMVGVEGADALALSRDLARLEGIFCGISGGAAVAGALAIAPRVAPHSSILCLLPDTGERYLSTPLFDSVGAEMTDEELEISNSLPSPVAPRAPASPQAPAAAPSRETLAAAEQIVDEAISDPACPVVMFGLQWCEFSWALRKFLGTQDIAHTVVELDSVAFTARPGSSATRAVLERRTGAPTIPQLFIMGQPVGGTTGVFDAWNEGRLQDMLRQAGIRFRTEGPDPRSHLPGWVAKRRAKDIAPPAGNSAARKETRKSRARRHTVEA